MTNEPSTDELIALIRSWDITDEQGIIADRLEQQADAIKQLTADHLQFVLDKEALQVEIRKLKGAARG